VSPGEYKPFKANAVLPTPLGPLITTTVGADALAAKSASRVISDVLATK
jgi:hypothetical protein